MKWTATAIFYLGFLVAMARGQTMGACFMDTSDCSSDSETPPPQDTSFVDCACMDASSFGVTLDGESYCLEMQPSSEDESRRGLIATNIEQSTPVSRRLPVWFLIVIKVVITKKTVAGFAAGVAVCKLLDDDDEPDIIVNGDNNVIIIEKDRRRQLRQRLLNECAEATCDGEMVGEPHIKQLLGGWFDYHGECDLVFSHAPSFGNGVGLDIHARTKIRYAYSYIESVAIRIGNDLLEISGYGQHFLNGVEAADLTDQEATMSGYPIEYQQLSWKQHSYEIDVGIGQKLGIGTMKDIVSIKVVNEGPEARAWFQNSTGLMGSYSSSRMLARDGITAIEDPKDFGQEWQVRDNDPLLFQVRDRSPQFPDKCILPNPDAQKSRRLVETISREAAELACKEWTMAEKEDCIYDVMATGDLELAEAGGY